MSSHAFLRAAMLRKVIGIAVVALSLASLPFQAVWGQGAAPGGAAAGAPESPAPKAKGEEGTNVEGSGYSLFDVPSIKGFDANKVQSAPICDPGRRPKVTKVEPDEVKPGDRVMIKGENFGPKECLQNVTFGSDPAGKFTLVDEGTIEATVPNSKGGMSFVRVVTGGGSAQSKPVLIKQ